MPYLSRVLLNPRRGEARKFFANPQLVKGVILGEFAQQPVSERVLWRLDHRKIAGTDQYQGELLILTKSRQSWAGLVERAGYPGSDGGEPRIRDYAPLLADVSTGREFAFKVRVNPVQNATNLRNATKSEAARMARDNHRRSLRVAHRTAAAQTSWFLERAVRWGFRVVTGTNEQPNVRIVDRRRLDFTKGRAPDRHHVRIGTATFEGMLQIVDADKFLSSLIGGVGPAKGYGCGLITLARPERVFV